MRAVNLDQHLAVRTGDRRQVGGRVGAIRVVDDVRMRRVATHGCNGDVDNITSHGDRSVSTGAAANLNHAGDATNTALEPGANHLTLSASRDQLPTILPDRAGRPHLADVAQREKRRDR